MFSLSQLQHWPQCPRQILYQDIIYADIMFTQIHNFTEKSPILQSLSKLVVSAQNKGKYYCWELNNKISNDNKTTLWYLIRSMYFTLLVFALWLSINCYVFSVSKYTWKKHLHKSIKRSVKSNEYLLNQTVNEHTYGQGVYNESVSVYDGAAHSPLSIPLIDTWQLSCSGCGHLVLRTLSGIFC